MDLNQLVSDLIVDTKGVATPNLWSLAADSSLFVFMPEIILCATMFLLLFVRIFDAGIWLDRFLGKWLGMGTAFLLTLVGSGLALAFAAPWSKLSGDVSILSPDSAARMEIFTGMLVYDGFSVFVRSLLLFFVFLFTIFTWVSGIPDREDGPDIYTLVLGATLGMCLMVAANHLLMVFMAIEMASVPSYVLAGMLKGKRKGSEAALKYSVYGAGAAGIMLYGISLVAGVLNSAHLPTIAQRLAERLPEMTVSGGQELFVLAVAGLMIMAGLAFKLSAVPFHFWCPDVFEGASAEVNAFLSVASKAAALALLVRVCLGIGALPPESVKPGARTAAAVVAGVDESLASASDADNADTGGLFAVREDEPAAAPAASPSNIKIGQDTLAPVRSYIGMLVALFAAITCTFGNLAAFGQTNIKRLLAYSTIAHAGYMMMAVPALMELVGVNNEGAQQAAASLGIYLGVYLFLNLGAFAVVAFLRNSLRSEEIKDYAGLITTCPWVVIMFGLMLFGLVGLPPLSGFLGKYAVFAALADGWSQTSQGYLMTLLVIGGMNTAISLFYYLRVVKTMVFEAAPEQRVPFTIPLSAWVLMFLFTLPTAVLIPWWEDLPSMALAAARLLVY